MSSYCQIQRGFFIQRTCGTASSLQCAKCQRVMCIKHQTISALPKALCVECAPEQADAKHTSWEDDHSPAHRHRRHHYGDGVPSAIWWSTGHSHFDDNDDRPFESSTGSPNIHDDDAFDDDAGFDDDGDVTAFDS